MSEPTDTIAALATPVGTSAIALIRVSGPDAAKLAEQIFRELPPPRLAQHADYRDRRGELVDDVLFTFFAGPNSFTGEDSLEISCHGNPFVAQKIVEDLLARGCRSAEAGEFSKRAFLSGRLDLSQAEAIMDLIHARSERALAMANQQLRGALGRRMEDLTSRLIRILAKIEAYIDFPEEDLPVEDAATIRRELEETLAGTRQLIATSHYGTLLRDGIKTIIVGEPNAGKSSLLNRLVGHERALVSAEPGTTRDYLEERIIMGPHWLRLIDTAGLNPSPGALERQGIEKALEQAETADLYLWVVDSSRELPSLPGALASRMGPVNTVMILNKVDLAPVAGIERIMHTYPVVRVSALKGTGIEQLQLVVTKMADAFQINVGGDLIAINARHLQALEQARHGLDAAMAKLDARSDKELMASDLRCTLEAFGQIAGRIDNERILDELFATFCIGK